MLLSLTTCHSSHAWFLTEVAQALEDTYEEAAALVTKRYTALTDKFHPQTVHWAPHTSSATPNFSFAKNFFWGTALTSDQLSYDSQINTYKNSIATIHNQGLTMHSIAIDWQKIEPQENVFNTAALNQYAALCQELTNNNIVPLITLFNGSMPQWFADKKGFLVYENIPLFVRFAQKVFTHLHQYKAYWISLANPNEYAALTYTGNFAKIVTTLEHMLIAHRDTYTALKKIDTKNKNYIGIAKNMEPFHPWNKFNPSHAHKARKYNQALHDAFYNFINNGRMDIYFTEVTKDDFYHSTFNSFDFISITYNAPHYIDSNYSYFAHANRIMHATNQLPVALLRRDHQAIKAEHTMYGMHPEGLYEALMTITKSINKKVPILVIQNTFNPHDNAHVSTLYALDKAYKNGCAIMGYLKPLTP